MFLVKDNKTTCPFFSRHCFRLPASSASFVFRSWSLKLRLATSTSFPCISAPVRSALLLIIIIRIIILVITYKATLKVSIAFGFLNL